MAEALFTQNPRNLAYCDFSEMNLQVGERVEFQLTPTRLHPRLYTRLIGYVPGESVLVRTPLSNNLPVNVHEGQQAVVRVFSGTKAFAFLTQVQRICIAPFLYLHLGFPAEIQCLEIRKNQRLPVRLLAEVKVKTLWKPALLLDLGMGGALVESAHPLGEPGEGVEVRFSFPVEQLEREVPLTVTASLLHVEAHPTGDAPPTWRQGVKFQRLGKGEKVMLQNFLLKMLVDAHPR